MPPFPEKRQLRHLSIARIKKLLADIEPDDMVLATLKSDPRTGVKALATTIERHREKAERLRRKQEELLKLERRLRIQGKKLIAGVDEAGRGPLAGPVVSAAVILPEDVDLPGVDDSKKLNAAKREELFKLITNQAIAWGVGMADNDEIDEIGILEATMKSMRIAVENLKMQPDTVLVDGNRAPGLSCDERAVVDGDALSLSIAAASIIAKVSRDRIMVELDKVFPGYGFARHKGYGSQMHVDALRRLGPCTVHRFSYAIVPRQSPPGTVVEILGRRLLNAPTREVLERTAEGIARIRDNLSSEDVEALRSVYSSRRASIKKNRKITGDAGEETSCKYLEKKGFNIITRNWRADDCNYEIDIIAQVGQTIVFCEVKTATSKRFGPSVSWVTPEKTDRIARAAQEYITTHKLDGHEYRFDVIGLQQQGEDYEIVHIENAFTAPENL
ncbi:ribonuclease HII [Candidatus Latescibacterota bacterium]